MIYIFHGDDQSKTRTAFNKLIESFSNTEIIRYDNKDTDMDKLNNSIKGSGLFSTEKTICFTNFFSITKATLDKVIKTINSINDNTNIVIWQDKTLNATQLKTFKQAKIESYKLSNSLFSCLNSIKPKNVKVFIPLYQKLIKEGLYDLFLYMVKSQLRKQLSTFTYFDKNLLKKTYIQLIELDYQNKSGQLSIPKEIALERTLLNLLK